METADSCAFGGPLRIDFRSGSLHVKEVACGTEHNRIGLGDSRDVCRSSGDFLVHPNRDAHSNATLSVEWQRRGTLIRVPLDTPRKTRIKLKIGWPYEQLMP
jgi:hypothetical protein